MTLLRLLLEEAEAVRATAAGWTRLRSAGATLVLIAIAGLGYAVGHGSLPSGVPGGAGAVRAGVLFYGAALVVQNLWVYRRLGVLTRSARGPSGSPTPVPLGPPVSVRETVLRILVRAFGGTVAAWAIVVAGWTPMVRTLGAWPVILAAELALAFGLVALGVNAIALRVSLEGASRVEGRARLRVFLGRAALLLAGAAYGWALWRRDGGEAGILLLTTVLLAGALLLMGLNRLSHLDGSVLQRLGIWPLSLAVAALAAGSAHAADHEEGIASYYAERFHGRPTASGEVFDMHALTAAHPTLPFGTQVRVVNLENGRSVTLRINDRGPFRGGRVIDVSYRAAEELDFLRRGIVRVRVETLDGTAFPRLRERGMSGGVWVEGVRDRRGDGDLAMLTLGLERAREYLGLVRVSGAVHLAGVEGVLRVATADGLEERVADTAGLGVLGSLRLGPRIRRTRPYVEVGLGLLITGRELPPGGSHENFTRRYGAGVSVLLGDGLDLALGYRRVQLSETTVLAPPDRDAAYTGDGLVLEVKF